MLLLVLGGIGMLGHKLWREASVQLDAYSTVRRAELTGSAAALNRDRIIAGVSVDDLDSVERAIEESDADTVVNCIGIVTQSRAATDPIPSIQVNSLFAHQVAAFCRRQEKRFIHISTDFVFSGLRGAYTEDDLPDASDLYGRSKLLGEATGPGSLTIRTSIVGRELESSLGLIEWFLGEASGTVRGFEKAIFSGSTTQALAAY